MKAAITGRESKGPTGYWWVKKEEAACVKVNRPDFSGGSFI